MNTRLTDIINRTSNNPVRFNILFSLLINGIILSVSLIPDIRGVELMQSISESDQNTYITNAYHLAESGNFTRDDAPPYLWEPYRTPGYPLFIALSLILFSSIVPALAFNVLFTTLAVYFGTKLLQQYTSDNIILIGYGILFTCFPNLAGLNCFLMTDSIAASLGIIWVYYLVKTIDTQRWKLIAPLTLAIIAAQLVKPTFNIAFVVILLAYCLSYWKTWRSIVFSQLVCVIAGCLIVPLFLSYRNYSSHHVFAPTLLSEATKREYLIPSYLSGKTGEDYNIIQKRFRVSDVTEAKLLEGNGISYYGNLHNIKKHKNDSIIERYAPGLALQIVKESAKQLFAPQEYLFNVFIPAPSKWLRIIGAGINFLYLVLIGLGLYLAFRSNVKTLAFIVIIMYALCLPAGALSARQGGRLKLPAEAVALAVAAIGLGYLKNQFGKSVTFRPNE